MVEIVIPHFRDLALLNKKKTKLSLQKYLKLYQESRNVKKNI